MEIPQVDRPLVLVFCIMIQMKDRLLLTMVRIGLQLEVLQVPLQLFVAIHLLQKGVIL
jgi:hypothetical protein